MWWAGARGWRPPAALLPAMVLACAAAVAAPLGAAAAPARPGIPLAHQAQAVELLAHGVGPAAAGAGALCPPPPRTRPDCSPQGRPRIFGRLIHHLVRGHGRPGGGNPSPAPHPGPPASTPPPAAPPVTEPVRVIFDNNAGLAAPAGRSVPAVPGNPAPGLTPAPGSGPPVGGILSVPQPSLLGPLPRLELGSAIDVWQVIAGAEGAALLAVLVALMRRRRLAGRGGA